MIQLNLFKKSLFYLCFQAYSGKKVKNLIEIESYVKSAEEVLTDALMRDLEENSDLDEVFDVDESRLSLLLCCSNQKNKACLSECIGNLCF